MKIVINKCFGGFGLSEKATMRYAEIKGIKLQVEDIYYGKVYQIVNSILEYPEYLNTSSIERDDLALVQTVEELGEGANGDFAVLAVVEIPDDVIWDIDEYDGKEWVAEQHRTWS